MKYRKLNRFYFLKRNLNACLNFITSYLYLICIVFYRLSSIVLYDFYVFIIISTGPFWKPLYYYHYIIIIIKTFIYNRSSDMNFFIYTLIYFSSWQTHVGKLAPSPVKLPSTALTLTWSSLTLHIGWKSADQRGWHESRSSKLQWFSCLLFGSPPEI